MKKVTFIDIFCIIFVAIFCTCWTIHSIKNISQASILHIDSPSGTYEYDLNKNNIIEIEGQNGKTVIEIKDKAFRFVSSECPTQSCVNCGFVHIANFPIVCLPNKVSAYILGKGDEDEIDDISR